MIGCIIMYAICGATWGFVLAILLMQKSEAYDELFRKYPSSMHIYLKIGTIILTMVIAAFAWPIEVPTTLYKLYIKK